ncbi:2-methylene-furan-3-one reductase [Sesamum angolense]|uniref:2-methylene-furan-3-one reductase n=1 Tax=Sesamum angolense TaxID=2727404 RepID=A0AAE1XG50_9LAMI|nr:2-methylene-furan-3-one reductase [Sesamum angolense]
MKTESFNVSQLVQLTSQYGPKEVLQQGAIPIPYPRADQLLVQVHAAALNPIDFKLRRNPLGPVDLPVVPGCDMAGVVVAKGDGVLRFDELVAVKPKNVLFEEAASLPVVVQTAVEGFKTAGFQEGQSVFIVGGAGGVGTSALQLAKQLYKASVVTATISTGKVDFLKGLGANKVVDYTKTRYVEVKEKYDFVFNTIGDSRKSYVVAKEGAPVIDVTWPPSIPRAQHTSLTVSGKILEELRPYLESRRLKAVIDPTSPFPFSNVIEAFGHLETGRTRGKVVISPVVSSSHHLDFCT